MQNKLNRPLQVGLIGAGLQGSRRAQAVMQEGRSELRLIADPSPKAGALADRVRCRLTVNWHDVIGDPDIDVIIVSTPNDTHHEICTAALKMGKHVLCEKPLARTAGEAQDICAAADKSGRVLKCGFSLRYHPAVSQAKDWFDQGCIGEPMFIRCQYGICGRPGYEADWRFNTQVSGGGQLMDQGMHAIDLARWFLGEFSDAFGLLQTAYWNCSKASCQPVLAPDGLTPIEDNAFALLRTSNGQVASLHVSWTQWKNVFSFEIFGREGYIEVKGLGGSYGIEQVSRGKRGFDRPFNTETVEFRGQDESWQREWNEFVSAIIEGKPLLGSGIDGMRAVEVAQAVYRSAREGRVVMI